MIFVIDLDDTVCDTDNYSEEYIKNFIKSHNLPYEFVDSYARFAENKFSWDRVTANNWYKTYGDEMMLNFPVKNNAVNEINKLYDMGYKIIICTARDTDWHTDPRGITLKWCQNVGLKYTKMYIGRVDKEKVCEDENADVFIDDDIAITTRVLEYFNSVKKGRVFLSNTYYNKNLEIDDNITRVNSFEEMTKILQL